MASRGLAFLLVVCLMLQGVFAWPVVQTGARGSTVVALQDLLKARGYVLAVDGIFGPITASAVINFQIANGLVATGIVGQLTWPKVIILVKFGSVGKAVHAVQYLLVYKYRFLAGAGSIDSVFGQNTKNAVIAFQSNKGLARDGIVGPITWQALVS
ncbi:hypothetical protein CBR_g42067 [Chara braunii]|uniref:Peptidoglycan binding-like domain-containing protein n=1 Tax=Chara braunii TaxID=69332 RepID=A0A388LWZ9_CHABU|nr:hypothetical protein CBR_g42067 [Chara braunii]|eukprot:GBG86783.1 hypothetical protein CBR_g42067 [Chara braunii]